MGSGDERGGLGPAAAGSGGSSRWPLLVLIVVVGFVAGIGVALTDPASLEQLTRLIERRPPPERVAVPLNAPTPSPVPTEEPSPSSRLRPANRSQPVTVQAARDGHFYVTAAVNGVDIRFLIDTGATAVVLSAGDAARVGLRPGSWEFTQLVETANGRVRLARTSLRTVRVGGLQVDNVMALVSNSGPRMSLLGMSFLQRLDRFEVRDRTLYLYD